MAAGLLLLFQLVMPHLACSLWADLQVEVAWLLTLADLDVGQADHLGRLRARLVVEDHAPRTVQVRGPLGLHSLLPSGQAVQVGDRLKLERHVVVLHGEMVRELARNAELVKLGALIPRPLVGLER